MIKIKKILIVCMGLALVMPAWAASDNGCGNDSNDRIAASLALCSTHAYNIGSDKNPGSSADKQYMNEVVALKSTLISQQMYKQYEYLDATIRRLKTQLEKAVLTANLQAAGAADTSNNSTAKSNDRKVVLSGAENCLLKSNESAVLDCLQSNLMYVRTANNSGNIGNAMRQLKNDIDAFNTWFRNKGSEWTPKQTLSSSKPIVEEATNEFNVQISRARSELNKQNNQRNYNMMGNRPEN